MPVLEHRRSEAGSSRNIGETAVSGAAKAGPSERDRPRLIAVVAPSATVDLGPRFSGELAELAVKPGDHVEAGELIARIDSRQLHEEIAVVRAALRSAKAMEEQAQVDVADSERKLRLEQQSVKAGTSPEADLETASLEADRARAALERARASVAEERAHLEKARNRLADAELRAPFGGQVAQRYRDTGEVAGPSAPVVRLIGNGNVRARFAVEPVQAGNLRLGQRVELELEPSGQRLPASISQISPELDAASNMIFVEADLGPEASRLPPGLAGWVTLL